MIKQLLHNVSLWFQYNDTYINIRKNKNLYRYMQSDPGVKFMRRGWWIAYLLFAAFVIFFNL